MTRNTLRSDTSSRIPADSWGVIKKIFFDHFGEAKPNKAHLALAHLEERGLVGRVITQNIDNLHQEAGSREVFEFHGNSKRLVCLACFAGYTHDEVSLDHLPPTCRQCGGLLKPDFVFFGEAIPVVPLSAAYEAATISEVFLVIGTTGEVMPANQFPPMAKSNGAKIIEINPTESNYTRTDHRYLPAGESRRCDGNAGEGTTCPVPVR